MCKCLIVCFFPWLFSSCPVLKFILRSPCTCHGDGATHYLFMILVATVRPSVRLSGTITGTFIIHQTVVTGIQFQHDTQEEPGCSVAASIVNRQVDKRRNNNAQTTLICIL